MRNNLLEFLFGETAMQCPNDDLGDSIVKIFEEAAELEAVEMVANKKPLADALKSIGVSGAVEPSYQRAELCFTDGAAYREAVCTLSDHDNIHKLAEMGWVAAFGGDIAQTNEPAEYKVNFIEISTCSDGENEQKAPDLEKVLKDGQKFASTPIDRDDEMNPVDNTRDDKKGEKQAGVGKAKEGEDPEGKPKGSTKKTEALTAEQRVNQLLETPDIAECELGSERSQAPFFRTDKNLGKKKKKVAEDNTQGYGGYYCRRCGKPVEPVIRGGVSVCPHCGKPIKNPFDEATMASAVPAVETGMAVKTPWRTKFNRLKKRRSPDNKDANSK